MSIFQTTLIQLATHYAHSVLEITSEPFTKEKQKQLIDFLLNKGFIYRDKKNQLKPYMHHVPKFFEVKDKKQGAWAGQQTLITPYGKQAIKLLLEGSAA